MSDNSGPGPNGEWATPPKSVGDGTLFKQWVAHGPSLFEWVAIRGDEYQVFSHRRDAVLWLTTRHQIRPY